MGKYPPILRKVLIYKCGKSRGEKTYRQKNENYLDNEAKNITTPSLIVGGRTRSAYINAPYGSGFGDPQPTGRYLTTPSTSGNVQSYVDLI